MSRQVSSKPWPAEGAGAAELARAKAQLKAGLLMSLESSSARAEQMARQMMTFGRLIGSSELIASVEAVTAEDVRAHGAGARRLRSRPWPSSARGKALGEARTRRCSAA